MKKVLAIAVVMGLAAGAQAASVGFDFGTNFYKPSAAGLNAENGTNFGVNWMLDNDLKLGIYNEMSNVTGVATGFSLSAIQIAKGVVKNVFVGLNLGAGTGVTTATDVDIFGTVNILSGTGEKVSGNLVATVAARFCKAQVNAVPDIADGYNLGLAANIGF